MASWGENRRNLIILVILILIIIPIGIITYSSIYEPPTCFDGKRNGGERGVDCGGNCVLLCTNQITEPIVYWHRFFQVSPGVYNVVAYVENPNVDAGTNEVNYKFELLNREGVILDERIGTVKIKPKEIVPIIEPNLSTGRLSASRVKFDFTSDIVWTKQEIQTRVLFIQDERLFEVDGLPRVSAKLKNVDIRPVDDISIVVIVYDKDDNAISTSSTFLTSINKNQTRDLIFTWPQPFSGEVGRFEIIPIYESSN